MKVQQAEGFSQEVGDWDSPAEVLLSGGRGCGR